MEPFLTQKGLHTLTQGFLPWVGGSVEKNEIKPCPNIDVVAFV
jgi:hypothetical protein